MNDMLDLRKEHIQVSISTRFSIILIRGAIALSKLNSFQINTDYLFSQLSKNIEIKFYW